MDAKLLLSIYTKLNQLYTDDESGRFLSFPIDCQYSFSPENLSLLFKDKATDVALSLHQMAEFSRTINLPVRGITSSSDTSDSFLWEIYNEILKTAEVAVSQEDELPEQYHEAFDYLYSRNDMGWVSPSEIYRQYNTCRDLIFQADEEIANLKSSASMTPEVRKNALQKAESRKADLITDWIVKGQKEKVEKCQHLIDSLTTGSPSVLWSRLKSSYDENIHLLTSQEDSDFAPTYLAPSNVLEQEWNTIFLQQEEIESLCGQAPEELKAAYPFHSSTDIESVSFEYRSVRIDRPWIDFSLFSSRYWRFRAHNGQEAISYGDRLDAGRFPAYVRALLLYRNCTVNYTNGEKAYSLHESAATQNNKVGVLAYICKNIPLCPNPDLKAGWPSCTKTVSLDVQQTAGGTVQARAEGTKVGDKYQVEIGQSLCFKAIPEKSDLILVDWIINGKTIPADSYTYECIMPPEGLHIAARWEECEPENFSELSTEGNRLLALSGGPAVLDMNKYARLCHIEIIGAEAFKNYTELQRIKLGNEVQIIGRAAFSACLKLENVQIPAATRSIHEDAFARDNFQKDPVFNISDNNRTYKVLEGIIVPKDEVSMVCSIRCPQCGASFSYVQNPPQQCPNCLHELEPTPSVGKEPALLPGSAIPFKVVAEEAIQKAKSRIAGRSLISREFVKALWRAEFKAQRIYVPNWEWIMQAEGSFTITAIEQLSTGEKDDQGNEIKKSVEKKYTEKASLPEHIINIPASRILDHLQFSCSGREKEKFTPEEFSGAIPIEKAKLDLFSSRKQAREQVIQVLQNEAEARHPVRMPNSTKADKVTFLHESHKLILFPVWVHRFHIEDKKYCIYQDGYTGDLLTSIKVPKDKKKIGIIIGVSLLLLAGLIACLIIFL